MFRTRRLQWQEPWTPFVVASAALAFALYYLHTHTSPSTASKPSQEDDQPCQASDTEHRLANMNPEERAYHERFMREAIAMVRRLLHILNGTWLTHHSDRLSLP
jgi:tRNA-specific adenosine deaminase 2